MKVMLEYFTDPLCAWSFVSEPTVQSLISDYGGKIDFRFRSLPILDRVQGEAKPGEKMRSPESMVDEWAEISERTGTKLNSDLWIQHPPHSSWPANRAMKAAFNQGFEKGNRYTHQLREAIMLEKSNPSDFETLKRLADDAGLDVARFHDDMTTHAPLLEQAIAEDRLAAMNSCINETPTLVMQNESGDKVIISGTLDYELASRAVRFLMGEKRIGEPEAEVASSI